MAGSVGDWFLQFCTNNNVQYYFTAKSQAEIPRTFIAYNQLVSSSSHPFIRQKLLTQSLTKSSSISVKISEAGKRVEARLHL